MNEIEKLFYNEFLQYVSSYSIFSVHDLDEGHKIADCHLSDGFDRSSGHKRAELVVEFKTLGANRLPDTLLVTLEPQVKIGPYVIDFELCMDGSSTGLISPRMVIEIDGHAWHEKNKEQAANDKRRDRELAARGLVVLRFTGSEAYQNPKKCVEEAIKTYLVLVEKYSQDYISLMDSCDSYIRNDFREFASNHNFSGV